MKREAIKLARHKIKNTITKRLNAKPNKGIMKRRIIISEENNTLNEARMIEFRIRRALRQRIDNSLEIRMCSSWERDRL